ncbi:hypothetical protein ACFL27_24780 [candidate division CSSED10-310 bacterium]|uniref:Uncharacterized protein n=1 Tax=candidate division CSSED10-310 bacterium TaxID=2855610 RepID=A0ABV6Z4R8_UNCC1
MRQLYTVLSAILLFNCFVLACNNDNNGSDEKADITINFNPNPVTYDYFDEDLQNYYWKPYTLYVDEKAGVGATLFEWKTEEYTANGTLLAVWDGPQIFFLDPYGEFKMTFVVSWDYAQTNILDGWYKIEKMKFKDDNRNIIEVSGQVNFLAVQD